MGRSLHHGQLLVIYLLVYPVDRAAIELWRGDPSRGYLVKLYTPGLNALLGLPAEATSLLSTSQVISAVMVAGALVLGWRLRRRAEAGGPAANAG